jgi:hypothetical protein
MCALFAGPVIVIYGPLFAYSLGVDLVRIGGAPIAAVLIASALAVSASLKVQDLRSTAKALFRRSYRAT